MQIMFFGIHGAVPSKQSGNVSLAVYDEQWSMLVDASGNPTQNLLISGIDPLQLDTLVLTHAHTDHLYGLPALIHSLLLLGRTKPLVCYANEFVQERAVALLDCFGIQEKPGIFPIQFSFPEYAPEADTQIQLIPVEHSTPTHGIYMSRSGFKLVYTADTSPCDTLSSLPGGLDLLIHESSGVKQEEHTLGPAGHASARQAAELACHLEAKSLMLCHVPPDPQKQQHILEEAKRNLTHTNAYIPRVFQNYYMEEL